MDCILSSSQISLWYFPGNLSYCLHLLFGFVGVAVDHGGRLSAIGSVWAWADVEGDPAMDTSQVGQRIVAFGTKAVQT
jgi:hypothetical protein